jgi:aminoglycoside 6-adenylyltransferase
VADHGLTGVLLVGGASERFGSPKALARLGDETLAERAWRVLHEVCDEVLAVGKAADGIALPFPILDDGAEERAPVIGLMAGLRAASHDVCLSLPVDCPLVTPDLLRELVSSRAVPQTGPLPGVYTKTMLPELESRVAGGQLSLKGVNSNVVQVDEKLLLNVNSPMDLVVGAIVGWAGTRDDVRAVVIVGSYARDNVPADRWSDLDVLLFVDDPEPFVRDSGWIVSFGRPVLTFREPTAVGGRVERRVLYEDDQGVDFVPLEASVAREMLEIPEVTTLLARGYNVLYDELGVEEMLDEVSAPANAWPPAASALTELASDFWYHALWTAKKLRRGEVYTAKGGLDGYLKARLVTLLEWHARSVDSAVDTWHGGRFLEGWADPGALAALESAYAHYDLRDVARALWATIDLWQGLEEETAKRLGLELELDHLDLRRRIAEVVPDPR